ncbi:hypothetical protein UA08_02839 [Talaromyces atroroseus]|uniref:Eisosome protein 1 n=1 Tax=Talaromyces atroroseus TaxID=1441469 RepID=A0A225AU46_TALAT|nr:hypothetical protein UA08_02839 [Talaromyces atroroseus]OKL61884.1 hypothetical protein UA08_02839 [Talaromyces atroroseus]
MAATRSNAVDLRRATSNHLADHAASAALYVTDPMRKRAGSETVSQEPQNQVSTLLAYVLPAGLTLANASAAASLAHANRKTTSPWRPAERQPYAEKAAAFARSYQSPEPPSPSKPHSDVYKAAILAAQDRVYSKSPPPTAAAVATTTTTLTMTEPRYHQAAMAGKGRRDSRETSAAAAAALQINPGALTAATGAVANRRRTESAPTKPVFHPDAAYALTAATLSHRASQDARNALSDLDPSMEAARLHHIARTNAQLYTSTPPVDIEVEEQKHKDTLRAAAISMAKDMYATSAAVTKEEPDGTGYASTAAQNRVSHRYSQSQFSWAPGDEYNAVPRTQNLHEAAQKLASEKLAKMQQNELQNKQQYYGTVASPKSRQTLTRRLRRRTSSDGDASEVDWERSEQIRNQMSSLQSRLHQIDEKKNQDREDLMEIARKNVHARIHDMDEKVYAHTGKASPNMQREWEEKAHERARQETEVRMSGFSRVSVGGERYMDQAEIEAIARSRIQPTLDEISNRVEGQRAREVEKQLEQEREQRLQELDRERQADIQAEEKQHKSAGLGGAQFIRRRSTKKGTGNLFSRTSRVILGKKEAEGDVNGVGEEQREGGTATSPINERVNEQPEQEAANIPTSATAPVNGTTEREGDTTQPSEAPVVSGATVDQPSADTPTSPRSGSRLSTWFKGKIGRRFSKPPPPEKEEKLGDNDEQAVQTGSQEAAAVGIDNPRAGPLSSNPVTETDLAPTTAAGVTPQMHEEMEREEEREDNDEIGNEEMARQWSSSTEHSRDKNMWSSSSPTSDQQDGGRRRRLHMSLRDMIARKPPSEQGSAAGSPLASPTMATSSAGKVAASPRPGPVPRMNTTERNELHDSFKEESLPPPPTLFQDSSRRSVSSSARDSKFSEDL